ncbi:aldo/keto reductase [Magnetospira sp. QH-2]|uniref:aldo/keto reductase n=1 Tax=Magnetospira sp. (strain QH-2) TaxID=1288970 RepID=UPI0003E80E22|nr:aldo/keto reductase [Magnetospira sp. QH-2]CCQ75112.1 putative Aldo/keto reductase [Magnetospira sp. QH-2]
MRYRTFGDTGVSISEIGLGTWQLGAEWGDVSDSQAQAILDTARDAGISFFDTADVYGLGRSEERIRTFLSRCSKPVFVATKLGRFPEPGWPENFTFESFRTHVEASLTRLGVEALDLTQMHCIPTEVLRDGAVFDHLRRLKTDGKIKAFGVSVETVEEGLICLEQEGVTSLQVIFNMFRQKPARELFDLAKAKGVAIIARVPMASGLLSGKFTVDQTFDKDDHRTFNRDGAAFNVGETFAGLPFEKGVRLADRLKDMVPEGLSLADMALRWILDHDAVSTVIPGATRPEQALSNARASDLPPLGADLHAQLAAFYDSDIAEHIRGAY